MTTHKEVLEQLKMVDDYAEVIENLWDVGKTAKVGGLEVQLISKEISDYEEGTVYKDYVYLIGGLLFLRACYSNSWDDSYDAEFELRPARRVMVPSYEVIPND